MANQEVAALGVTVSQLVSVIQDLGNYYFQADAAWRDFPRKVESLQSAHAGLRKKVESFGLRQDTDRSVFDAVKEATKLLDGKVAKLTKRRADSQACARKCFGYHGILFCKKSVDPYLRVAEGAYSKILEQLDPRLQKDVVLEEIVEPFRLTFSDDKRYVRRDESEKKIISALQEAGADSAVVLLSGGPGRGKSTLARQICLRYGEMSSIFTQIVMLECGPDVNVAAKEMELLQKLGGHVSQQSRGVDFNVWKGLEDCLNNRKLLVILDDVWECELLNDLVRLSRSGSGSGAKWLVTSQQKNICDSLHCESVIHEIEDLSQADARKILASHAGFEDKKIPPLLLEVADEIIKQAQANPLVMATLGAWIMSAGREQVEVWESVLDDLTARLDDGTLVNVHGITYPRSFWKTMKRSIDFLHCDQKQLLVLISMCRDPSIPRPALQFLYIVAISQDKGELHDFRSFCNELEARHLLAENDVECLSIHSLTKGFILDQMKESVEVLKTLLNEACLDGEGRALISIKARVTRVLADLFIDAKFRNRITTMQNDLRSNRLVPRETQQPYSAIMELKRTATVSIMKLLVLKAGPSSEWTGELAMCVNQVLLEFADNDCLDLESISKLLGSSHSVLPILTFLRNVCLLESSFWEGNSIESDSSISLAVLNLLRDSSSTEWRNEAASVLADLCWSHKENSTAFASTSGMLPQLSLLLSQVHNSDLRKYAAKIVAACAYWDYYFHGTVTPKIVAEAGLVDSLVDLLAKDENQSVQIAVAHALCNLATAKPIVRNTGVSQRREVDACLHEHKPVVSGSHRDVLAQWPGLLEVLVKSLSRNETPVLQVRASSTIANIASTDENASLDKLVNFTGLVDKLVSTLSDDKTPQLQKQSARAIYNLAKYRAGSSIRQLLLHWPELLEGLTKSLLKFKNPSLQVTAAKAISQMAFRIEKEAANRVSKHPGLVGNLMQLLDEESQNSCVLGAAPAVSALCSLTNVGDDSLRATVVSSSPLLATLTKSVLTGADRAFEADVVCLLANLAVTKEAEILDKIAGSPGLVDKLAKSLAEYQSSLLQVNAMRTLLNLAGEEKNDNFDISCFPEVLQRLKEVLLHNKHLVLRETIVAALTSLIATKKKAGVDVGLYTWALLDDFITGLSKEQIVRHAGPHLLGQECSSLSPDKTATFPPTSPGMRSASRNLFDGVSDG